MKGVESARSSLMPVTPLLDDCLSALNQALRFYVRPGAGLWDPQDDRVTPEDHYGQLGSALALLSHDDSDRLWQQPFDAWRALPLRRTGHAPFNRFLLLLMADVLRSRDASERALSPLLQALPRCRLAQTYPSNNWSLLAQLCRLMEAPMTSPVTSAGAGARRRFLDLLARWTTPAGGFIDYPARPVAGKGATPLTYHCKALFVTTVAAWYTNDAALAGRVQQLLEWTLLGWDGWRHAGGFGRSTHAVFGDACLLASLVLLGFAAESRADTMGGRMLRGILLRWREQRREDGLLWLNPAGVEEARAGWDDYMHLSVYNAWAAGILQWARHAVSLPATLPAVLPTTLPTTLPVTLSAIAFPAGDQAPVEDPVAGLLRTASHAGDGAVLMSTRGQPPQSFGFTRVDFRYAGAVPYHLAWRGRVLCPPPAQVESKALLDHPALAGWTPVFLIGGDLYGLTDFTAVTAEDAPDRGRCVVLTGQPVPLLRTPARGAVARLVSALDWRFCDGALLRRRAVLRRVRAGEIDARIVFTIAPEVPRIACAVTLTYRGGRAVRWLNPCGHALVAGSAPFSRRCSVREAGVPMAAAQPLLSQALPSSIPGAVAYCLPAIDLAPGETWREVVVEWSPETPV